MTYNEYMYERSIAQIQFMAADSTHTKYLQGKDKKRWEDYLKTLAGQKQLEGIFASGKIG